MTVLGIDHVQVAAPPGCEDEARAFYGGLLGMEELPKPEAIRGRGGCWFRAGAQELHVGVEEPFAPARKAHPGLVVYDLDALRARLAAAGTSPARTTRKIAGVDRLFVHDPFGNRLEVRQGQYKMCLWTRASSQRSARSSSGAASRRRPSGSGVTQPAVSLQIQALEKRLGTKLLDRSGRRVEPTEAGMRLYRGAQRLLALEEQVVAEVGRGGDRGARGPVRDRRLDRARRDRALAPPLRVPARSPGAPRRCSGSSTRRRSSSGSPAASSSSGSSAPRGGTAASSSSRSSATR